MTYAAIAPNGYAQTVAQNVYSTVANRARKNQVVGWLTRRSNQLQSLSESDISLEAASKAQRQVKKVKLQQITGSVNRSSDFDGDFNPTQRHTQQRWLSIAVARQEGKRLPLVELLQIGNDYYVQDGHHRISVAKAWGQDDIEAIVTVM